MKFPEKIERVLVIKPSSLGDIFHVFPALELLRRRFPEAELDFLVHPAFAEILDYSPWPVRHKILFERKRLGRLSSVLPEFVKLTRALRERRYDLVIDFQGLTRSALFARLARRGGPVVGFAAPREKAARFGYTLRLPVAPGHAVERNVGLVNHLLGTDDAPPLTELPLNPVFAREAKRLLAEERLPAEKRPLAVLLPGARWPSKCFPPRLFAESVREFHKLRPEFRFAVVGAAGDRKPEEEILRLAGPDIPFIPLAGKTSLGTMVEVLRHAEVVLSNDSGPIHAAAALGRPIVGLFGPTSPERTGPYGGGHRILTADLDCLECLKRDCPGHGESLPCHRLRADAVARAMADLVKSGGPGGAAEP